LTVTVTALTDVGALPSMTGVRLLVMLSLLDVPVSELLVLARSMLGPTNAAVAESPLPGLPAASL
tara:strand:+ start:226 stop:420 length:195 start_codon:yes stop_codon:yes gene_type:complete